MDIFLVRHGEAAVKWGDSPDPGLSELGRQQAEAAAGQLQQGEGGLLLISSPLQRAIETAAPLSKLLRAPVKVDAAFREIPSPVPLAQRQAWLRRFMQQQWHEQTDELNTWRRNALHQLQELRQGTAIFTHFLLINAIVGQLLERPETLCFWPANGSITHLRQYDTGLELIALGQELTTKVN